MVPEREHRRRPTQRVGERNRLGATDIPSEQGEKDRSEGGQSEGPGELLGGKADPRRRSGV
jgi:hypothetical protein